MNDPVAWCTLAALAAAGVVAPVAYYLGRRAEAAEARLELAAHRSAIGHLLIARRCLLEELQQIRAERSP